MTTGGGAIAAVGAGATSPGLEPGIIVLPGDADGASGTTCSAGCTEDGAAVPAVATAGWPRCWAWGTSHDGTVPGAWGWDKPPGEGMPGECATCCGAASLLR
jgi:hypothetical protein